MRINQGRLEKNEIRTLSNVKINENQFRRNKSGICCFEQKENDEKKI